MFKFSQVRPTIQIRSKSIYSSSGTSFKLEINKNRIFTNRKLFWKGSNFYSSSSSDSIPIDQKAYDYPHEPVFSTSGTFPILILVKIQPLVRPYPQKRAKKKIYIYIYI